MGVRIPLLLLATGEGASAALQGAGDRLSSLEGEAGISLLAGRAGGPWVDLVDRSTRCSINEVWQAWLESDSGVAFPPDKPPFCDFWCVVEVADLDDAAAGFDAIAQTVTGWGSADVVRAALLFRRGSGARCFPQAALDVAGRYFDHLFLLDAKDEYDRPPGNEEERQEQVAEILAALITASRQDFPDEGWESRRFLNRRNAPIGGEAPANFGTLSAGSIVVDVTPLIRACLGPLLPDPDRGVTEERLSAAATLPTDNGKGGEGTGGAPSLPDLLSGQQVRAILGAEGAALRHSLLENLPGATYAESMVSRLDEARRGWERSLGAYQDKAVAALRQVMPAEVGRQGDRARNAAAQFRLHWAHVAEAEGLRASVRSARETERAEAKVGNRAETTIEATHLDLSPELEPPKEAKALQVLLARATNTTFPTGRQVLKAIGTGLAFLAGGVAVAALAPHFWPAAVILSVLGLLPFAWWAWRLSRGRRRLREAVRQWCDRTFLPEAARRIDTGLLLPGWREVRLAREAVRQAAQEWAAAVEAIRATMVRARDTRESTFVDLLDPQWQTVRSKVSERWSRFLSCLTSDPSHPSRCFEQEFWRPVWGEVSAVLDVSNWPPDSDLQAWLNNLAYAMPGAGSLTQTEVWWLLGEDRLRRRIAELLPSEVQTIRGRLQQVSTGEVGLRVVRVIRSQRLASLHMEEESPAAEATDG